jgi:hypothetical protein
MKKSPKGYRLLSAILLVKGRACSFRQILPAHRAPASTGFSSAG